MTVWNIRQVPEDLGRDVKAHAARKGIKLRELVIQAVRKEVGDGLREVEGNVGTQDVPGMRSGVQDDNRVGRKSRSNGAGTVQRPPDGASADSGTVGNGVREDSGGERPSEKRWLGPAHAKDCGCKACAMVKLTTEQFFALPKSEQSRAMREGKF
jgi:hypothetical protein